MGISTHILDTTRGRPAVSVDVKLERLDQGVPTLLGQGQTDADGRVKGLLVASPEIGSYRITFDVGPYFKAQGVEAFYPEVSITFEVRGEGEHYHVPLLLNPFGYSTYRGS